MSHCTVCGGFKGEVGKLYGYAGKWCQCGVTLIPMDFTQPMPNHKILKSMGMCPECWGKGAILNSHKCSEYYKNLENRANSFAEKLRGNVNKIHIDKRQREIEDYVDPMLDIIDLDSIERGLLKASECGSYKTMIVDVKIKESKVKADHTNLPTKTITEFLQKLLQEKFSGVTFSDFCYKPTKYNLYVDFCADWYPPKQCQKEGSDG